MTSLEESNNDRAALMSLPMGAIGTVGSDYVDGELVVPIVREIR